MVEKSKLILLSSFASLTDKIMAQLCFLLFTDIFYYTISYFYL